MRRQVLAVAALLTLTSCAATHGTPTALPLDAGRRMHFYIPGADSAQVVDALGRKLACEGNDCVEIPHASYGYLERRAGIHLAFGPEISPPLRLIAWARNSALYPQIELYESTSNVPCRVADIPDATPGMRCEWIIDVTPGDSLTNCKLILTRLKPKPARGSR